VCFYVGCVAFWLIGVWKAPYGFQDKKGFHALDASAPEQNRPAQEAINKRKIAAPFQLGHHSSHLLCIDLNARVAVDAHRERALSQRSRRRRLDRRSSRIYLPSPAFIGSDSSRA
jgi:hypothetical protein